MLAQRVTLTAIEEPVQASAATAGVKAVDRLLGSAKMQRERLVWWAALATRVLETIAHPKISAKSSHRLMARGTHRRRKQLALTFRTWGGTRAGAGRRPKGAAAGVSHLRRPAHSRQHPAHVTLRIVRGVPSLRSHTLFQCVQRALAYAKERFGFRLIHFSVQRDHLHLIAEVADRRALSRGVQGLTIRVARAVNGQLHRKGRLFADRYHARALSTPRACSLALRYVLLNARKHAKGAGAVPAGFVDPCSSGSWFAGFARPRELAFGAAQGRARFARATGMVAPIVTPRIWLLRGGLKRAKPFDVDEAPAAPT